MDIGSTLLLLLSASWLAITETQGAHQQYGLIMAQQSDVALLTTVQLREQVMQSIAAAQADPAHAFQAWAMHHAKPYLQDAAEYERRHTVWLRSLEYISNYNKKHTSHWLALTSWADMEDEEYAQQFAVGFQDRRRGQQRRQADEEVACTQPFLRHDADVTALPSSINWSKMGVVTKVKNQNQGTSCPNACWSFTTAAAVESLHAILTQELVDLSEQELLDCCGDDVGSCADGGDFRDAMRWIVENGGIDTEVDYPYMAKTQFCPTRVRDRRVVSIDGCVEVPYGSEADLQRAVAKQPVAIAMRQHAAFRFYGGGVFDDAPSCRPDPNIRPCNHAMLLVGYGSDSQGDYWIIKNSFGRSWGEDGYMRLKRNVPSEEYGMCGITYSPAFPVGQGYQHTHSKAQNQQQHLVKAVATVTASDRAEDKLSSNNTAADADASEHVSHGSSSRSSSRKLLA